MTVEELKVVIKADMANYKSAMKQCQTEIDKLRTKTEQASKASKSFGSSLKSAIKSGAKMALVAAGIGSVIGALKNAMSIASASVQQETKLTTIMKTRMKATDETTQAIIQQCAALSEVGVIGKTAAMAGAQQVATYLEQASSIQTLLPEMENLAAQMKGVNVTAEDMVSIGNMVGKAIATNSLTQLIKAGILFTEQEKAKWQTLNSEQEKAAFLAQVIRNNVGNMNEALAQTYPGRVAQLKNEFNGLLGALGGALQNILYPVVTALTAIISRIKTAMIYFKKFTELLFGNRGDTSAISDTEESLSNSEDYAGGVASNLGTAAKNAKKTASALKGLAGIDEINALSKVNDNISGSGGSGGGGSVSSGTVTLTPEIDGSAITIPQGLKDLADYVKKWYNTYIKPTFDAFSDLCKSIWGNIEPYLNDFKKGFGGIFDGIGKILGNAIKGIGGLIKILSGLFSGDSDKIYEGAADFAEAFGGIFEGIGDIGDGLKNLGAGLLKVIGQVLVNIGTAIGEMFDDLIANLLDFFDIEGAWKSFKTFCEEIWKKICNLGGGIGSFFSAVFTGAANIGATITAGVKEAAGSIAEKVSGWWNTIKSKAADLTATIVDKASGVRDKVLNTWDSVKNKTAELTAKVVDKASSVRQKLEKTWDKFKNKTATLTATFKDVFTSKLKSAWNAIAGGINSGINIINKIPGVNIPHVPRLARGGITTGSTLANIGEAGKEAVLPLENNTGWMTTLAKELVAQMGNGSNDGSLDITLNIGGTKFGKACINSINQAQRQSGAILLNI